MKLYKSGPWGHYMDSDERTCHCESLALLFTKKRRLKIWSKKGPCVLKPIFRSRKKNFDYLCNRLFVFFLPTFHENVKFLKNCLYDFHKILHSHSTPKGPPACANASKSYDWNVRNIAKISPKIAKKHPFFDFFDFRKNCPYDSNESFYSHFLHDNMFLCVQFQKIRMTGIRESQKEKDFNRLLYGICGSGFSVLASFFINCKFSILKNKDCAYWNRDMV